MPDMWSEVKTDTQETWPAVPLRNSDVVRLKDRNVSSKRYKLPLPEKVPRPRQPMVEAWKYRYHTECTRTWKKPLFKANTLMVGKPNKKGPLGKRGFHNSRI
jgi:hypothetical protein